MAPASSEWSSVARKVQKACIRCRTMKVKCSGTDPCVRCAKRKRQCQYAVEENRVSVPESYLRELERRNTPAVYSGLPPPHQQQSLSSRRQERTEDVSLQQDARHSRFSRNPLVEYSFAATPDGRWWYLGPTSSWSFCRRVLALLGEQVPEANHPPDPWNLDGTAFKLKWWPLPPDGIPDLSDLPPLDYGLYLLQTVRFNFGPLFYIIDESTFTRNLYGFYASPEERARDMPMWLAQYLLVIAFGKAFLAPCRRQNAPPDGYQYAARAMSLMPDMSGVLPKPLQCIEALALAALYFQSIDMRVAAYNHIGFALRVCIIEGIHRHVPEELIGEDISHRCKIIFWIVYMLDREFAALMGAPSSIRDEDITVKLFEKGSVDEQTLTLHVKLARLSARILAAVYGVGSDFDGTLIKDTQSIFRDLAELSQDLNDLLRTHFHGSFSRASRAATGLILAYHHCVVLTTRPLVMCALHAHIEHTQTTSRAQSQSQSNTPITDNSSHQGNAPDTNPSLAIPLSPTITTLLQCCVESAQTTLYTLRSLADSDLLEAFLPFQIEDAFASTFLLYVIHIIAPSLAPRENWAGNAEFVLEGLVSKGNLAAPMRKQELVVLEGMLGRFSGLDDGGDEEGTAGSEPGVAEARVVSEPEVPTSIGIHMGPSAQMQAHAQGQEQDQESQFDWDIFAVDTTVGLEPSQLLDLADQLDAQGIMDYAVP
ncbi:fungal-specific transcription factor domain-containing protein [Aspergillus venezuelensis]